MQGTNALPLGVAVEIEAIVQVLHITIAAFISLIRLGPNSPFESSKIERTSAGHEHICKQGSQPMWPTMLERNILTLKRVEVLSATF